MKRSSMWRNWKEMLSDDEYFALPRTPGRLMSYSCKNPGDYGGWTHNCVLGSQAELKGGLGVSSTLQFSFLGQLK
jgi:hypothetical protein